MIFPDSGERYLSTPLFTVREKVGLRLFNTLTRRKEAFEPLVAGKVSIYSCGPTAHARIHLGECRRFVFSDLLCRYLGFRGYDVNHVMNITDMDDKTIEGSEKAGQDLGAFTRGHIGVPVGPRVPRHRSRDPIPPGQRTCGGHGPADGTAGSKRGGLRKTAVRVLRHLPLLRLRPTVGHRSGQDPARRHRGPGRI